MNEYEYLYEKKKLILQEIKGYNIFKLSKKDAIHCVMVKVGMLCCFLRTGKEGTKQEYLRKLIGTNYVFIDEVSFIQESLKWICRWCSEYCPENSDYTEKIYADEIYSLMGRAYAYDIFNDYCFFHSKHTAKFRSIDNVIYFDDFRDEINQIHKIYNTVWHRVSDANNFEVVFNGGEDKLPMEILERVHRTDFSFDYNFNFGEFLLKDYEEFSVGLNNYVIRKMSNPHVAIPGEEGLISLTRKDWSNVLVKESGLPQSVVEKIIDFFTYDFNNKSADLSLTYFFPQDEERLLLSEEIFYIQRPAANALRLLAKKQSELYKAEQNQFEEEQKKRVINKIGDSYEIAKSLTREQQLRPGMDMVVYDEKNNHLHIIELKYKVPVESARDIINLDDMLKKAYEQVILAEEYVKKNRETILEEYFGVAYHGVVPMMIDCFVLTNYSIGTGSNAPFPSPILLEEHYVTLMKLENGMQRVHNALNDKGKGCIGMIKKRYARFSLPKCKFKIPEYTIQEQEVKL